MFDAFLSKIDKSDLWKLSDSEIDGKYIMNFSLKDDLQSLPPNYYKIITDYTTIFNPPFIIYDSSTNRVLQPNTVSVREDGARMVVRDNYVLIGYMDGGELVSKAKYYYIKIYCQSALSSAGKIVDGAKDSAVATVDTAKAAGNAVIDWVGGLGGKAKEGATALYNNASKIGYGAILIGAAIGASIVYKNIRK